MMQAYVVHESIPPVPKGVKADPSTRWPYCRQAWVAFLFQDSELVVDYAFCHEPQAEQRAEQCAAEWRAGAPWALRRAAA